MLLQAPVGIHVEDRRRRRRTGLAHQHQVIVELLAHRRRDFLLRLERAGLAGGFMLFQRRLRVVRRQQRSGLAQAVGTQHADHDMTQLHLAGLDPGPGLLPEHVAVRAIGVAEHVHHARRVVLAVGDPGGLLQARPHFLAQRLVDQLFQRSARQIVALRIEQTTDQHVLAVGRQVQGDALAVVARRIALEPTGRLEAAYHLGATRLDGADRFRPLFGLHERSAQQAEACKEKRSGSNHCGDSSFSTSRARARLARESSPRWLPTWRPSAS